MSLPNAWYYIFFIANFYSLEHVFFFKIFMDDISGGTVLSCMGIMPEIFLSNN